MHHHVALATLVVREGEVGVVNASTRELIERLVKLLLLLIFFHLRGAWLPTLRLLKRLHDLVSLIVLFYL